MFATENNRFRPETVVQKLIEATEQILPDDIIVLTTPKNSAQDAEPHILLIQGYRRPPHCSVDADRNACGFSPLPGAADPCGTASLSLIRWLANRLFDVVTQCQLVFFRRFILTVSVRDKAIPRVVDIFRQAYTVLTTEPIH